MNEKEIKQAMRQSKSDGFRAMFPSLTEKKNRIGKSNSEDFSKNLHFFSF